MVERVIVKTLPAFTSFGKYVVKYIERQFSKEASQKSDRHCFRLLELSETKQQDMVKILRLMNEMYVPYARREQVLFLDYNLERTN